MADYLTYSELLDLADSGDYGGARVLSPLTSVILLSWVEALSNVWRWTDYDDDSSDDIDAAVSAALSELMTEVDVMSVPLGTILPTACASAPDGYHEMDGTYLLASEYPDLWDVIDDGFKGTLGGEDAIHLKDMVFETIVGHSAVNPYYYMGVEGGEVEHTLSQLEMPSHSHGVPAAPGAGGENLARLTYPDTSWAYQQSEAVGGGEPHNNMPPYICVRYMMRVE